MNTELTLAPQDFFEKGKQIAQLQSLITNCMQHKGSLVLELTAQAVRICVEAAKEPSAPLRLIVQHSMPDLNLGAIDQVGAKLIFPLLVDIQSIGLPHNQIFYLGREFRSCADFFARNLFFAAVRNVTLDIQAATTHQIPEPAKQFKHEYFFILKHGLPEDHLKNRNAKESIDLIAVNARLNARYFSHALLNCNLSGTRSFSQHKTAENHLAELKIRLLETRSALLAQV